jgi:nicotinamidase-related amidase
VSAIAVVVIDMLNPYDHEDAEPLAASAAEIVEPLSDLVARARAEEREDGGADLIYVNDSYGDFTATRQTLVRRALDGRRPDLIEPIAPPDDVDFIFKVRHSAFYSTSLEYLLRQRRIERVVLTGQVTEQCILYSALDAYVRHYDVRVVRDGVAHIDPRLSDAALRMMERNMRAEIVDAADALG